MPTANVELLEELAVLRKKVQRFEGAMHTVWLDAMLVHPSRWNHRDESSFQSPACARLKESIAATGHNAQPIVVREVGGACEIVFGHRRHRACLELGLPVLAVVWDRQMSAVDHFVALEVENREREDPSCLEQGRLYLAALAAGLVASRRRLAETLGVTHTWINKPLSVAELPLEVIKAFPDPRKLQPVHADAIRRAMETASITNIAEPAPQRNATALAGAPTARAVLSTDPLLKSSGLKSRHPRRASPKLPDMKSPYVDPSRLSSHLIASLALQA